MSNKEKSTSVFRLKPESNTNRAVIKYVGELKENDKLGDEIIELDIPLHPDAITVGRHAIPLKKIDNFDMIGRLYRCNIVGTHIVVSRRYPLMFLNVHYDRPLVSGSLFQLFISLDMDNAKKREIMDCKNNAMYVNLNFSGTWYLHIDCDEELIENYEKYLVKMLEDEAEEILIRDSKEIISIKENIDDEMMNNWIDNYVRENRVFYDELIKEREFKFTSITKVRDWFIELCQSEKFNKFVLIAMKCREMYRRKQAGIEDNTPYIIPTHITKMTDISKKMIDDGELILDDDY